MPVLENCGSNIDTGCGDLIAVSTDNTRTAILIFIPLLCREKNKERWGIDMKSNRPLTSCGAGTAVITSTSGGGAIRVTNSNGPGPGAEDSPSEDRSAGGPKF